VYVVFTMGVLDGSLKCIQRCQRNMARGNAELLIYCASRFIHVPTGIHICQHVYTCTDPWFIPVPTFWVYTGANIFFSLSEKVYTCTDLITILQLARAIHL
jgi:hypothetical protein